MVLEGVLVVSAGLTLVVFGIWFFFFAGASPVPIGIQLEPSPSAGPGRAAPEAARHVPAPVGCARLTSSISRGARRAASSEPASNRRWRSVSFPTGLVSTMLFRDRNFRHRVLPQRRWLISSSPTGQLLRGRGAIKDDFRG